MITLNFENGLTIRQLKQILAGCNETEPDGEDCLVWIKCYDGGTHKVEAVVVVEAAGFCRGKSAPGDIIFKFNRREI